MENAKDECKKGNATYLFQQPKPRFHNGENFWSSLLAMYILYSSNSCNSELCLPVCKHIKGHFHEDSAALIIPANLSFTDVIVDGKITDVTFHKITDANFKRIGPIPNEFYDLRPDLTIIKENRIIFIENKTIGASLSVHQRDLYGKLVAFLSGNGLEASIHFLVSAGYEGDWKVLDSGIDEVKLILWEQLLELMNGVDWINTCFGGLKLTDYTCIKPDIIKVFLPSKRVENL